MAETEWEYQTARMTVTPEWIEENESKGWEIWTSEIDAWLNILGENGWELVGPYTTYNWQVEATFKRPHDGW